MRDSHDHGPGRPIKSFSRSGGNRDLLQAAAALDEALSRDPHGHRSAGDRDRRRRLQSSTAPQNAAHDLARFPGTSQWPTSVGQAVLGVDLYVPKNYPAATVQTDGERTVADIKNKLKADEIGIVGTPTRTTLIPPP